MIAFVRAFEEARRHARGKVGLVPTMGYLHEGHISLLEAARSSTDTVVMSLFVNPLQFGDPSDLERYPRDEGRDLAIAVSAGVDVLFAPSGEEMFPLPPVTRVMVARLTERMEGPNRPGHFEGVATVVAKLLAGIQPDVAYFGRKDAQQLAIVKRMALDLSFPTEVVARPTVREQDGLALSSRNVLLTTGQRRRALGLHRGLFAAAEAVEAGERDGARLEGLVRAEAPDVDFEYVELASQDEAQHLPALDRPAFLAVAASFDGVRLIDNLTFDLIEGRFVPDRGRRLDRPSVLYGGE